MRNFWLSGVALCRLFGAQGCRAPSPDWNGTWKVNIAKSSFQSPLLTITVSPNDEYHLTEGNSTHDLRCNGKDQPVGKSRTVVCVKQGDTVLNITQMEGGIKTLTTRDELSTDRKTFTITTTEFRSNGPVTTSRMMLSRLSGSDGFGGQWRDTSYLQQHAEMNLRLDKQALNIDYPDAGQSIDAPLNGVDVPVGGPRAVTGSTIAVRLIGKRDLVLITKLHGQVFSQSSLKLSGDRKSLIYSSSKPDQSVHENMLVYERK